MYYRSIDEQTALALKKMGGLGKVMGLRKNIDMVLEMYQQFLAVLANRIGEHSDETYADVIVKPKPKTPEPTPEIPKKDAVDPRKREAELDRIMREHGIHRLEGMGPMPKGDPNSPVYKANMAKWQQEKAEWDKQNAVYQAQRDFYGQFIGKTPQEIVSIVKEKIKEDKTSKVNNTVLKAVSDTAVAYTPKLYSKGLEQGAELPGGAKINAMGEIEGDKTVLSNIIDAMTDPNSTLPYDTVPSNHMKLIVDSVPNKYKDHKKGILGDTKLPPKQDLSKCGLDGLVLFAIDAMYSQVSPEKLVEPNFEPEQYSLSREIFDAYKTKEVVASKDSPAKENEEEMYRGTSGVIHEANVRAGVEKARATRQRRRDAEREQEERAMTDDEIIAKREGEERERQQGVIDNYREKYSEDNLEEYRTKRAEKEARDRELKFELRMEEAERLEREEAEKNSRANQTPPTSPNQNGPHDPEHENDEPTL